MTIRIHAIRIRSNALLPKTMVVDPEMGFIFNSNPDPTCHTFQLFPVSFQHRNVVYRTLAAQSAQNKRIDFIIHIYYIFI
jgi:hypothetical protein